MPSVTDYIGAVTGAVGMVAGIYSLVRTHKIKSLDLRLELRTTVADVHLALATARACWRWAINPSARIGRERPGWLGSDDRLAAVARPGSG